MRNEKKSRISQSRKREEIETEKFDTGIEENDPLVRLDSGRRPLREENEEGRGAIIVQ